MLDIVSGTVAPGFEGVREVFERNFTHRHEVGAAVAASWYGHPVVDLWGGRRSADSGEPWAEDTMVAVGSATQGVAALTLALANSRGWLEYDVPVARYWPEFVQNGKGAVTVRQLLAHEVGLLVADERLTGSGKDGLDELAQALARQKPLWPPGTRHGLHALSLGLYMQELIRRVDPKHRALERFFQEELARPLGLELHLGPPSDLPAARVAKVKGMPWTHAVLALTHAPGGLRRALLSPRSLLRRSFDFEDSRWGERGVGTPRSIARLYSEFAEGGEALSLSPSTFGQLTRAVEGRPSVDVVLGVPTSYSLGFMRPARPPGFPFGSSPRAFGAAGAGGSFGFADPDAHLGYAYAPNHLDLTFLDDPRELLLREAVFQAMRVAPPPMRLTPTWAPPRPSAEQVAEFLP